MNQYISLLNDMSVTALIKSRCQICHLLFFFAVDKVTKACRFQLCDLPPGLLRPDSLWTSEVNRLHKTGSGCFSSRVSQRQQCASVFVWFSLCINVLCALVFSGAVNLPFVFLQDAFAV